MPPVLIDRRIFSTWARGARFRVSPLPGLQLHTHEATICIALEALRLVHRSNRAARLLDLRPPGARLRSQPHHRDDRIDAAGARERRRRRRVRRTVA